MRGLETLEGRSLMSATVTQDAFGNVTVSLGNSGQQLEIVDSGQGAAAGGGFGRMVLREVGGSDLYRWTGEWGNNLIVNGGNGSDSLAIVGNVSGLNALTFNGENGSDSLIVNGNVDGSVTFNGGRGNDTQSGADTFNQ